MDLLKYNRHWEQGFTYPFPRKRPFFHHFIQRLPKKEIVALVGLRRVGKSTLFFQAINHLLKEKTDPFSIWYFTFDEERMKLEDLVQNFSKQTNLNWKNEKIYLFLDEIQKLPGFQNQLKVLYDLYPNLKFFLSGSTSLFIRKKTLESLAGRVASFTIPPLNFQEYLFFKDMAEILEKPLVFHREIEREFELFLESQFIETLDMKAPMERREYLTTLLKKVVFEDIPSIFSLENPEILWRIIRVLGQNPGMIVDYQNLSMELGISNKTLSSYFFYLEEAFLIKKVYNFSKNLLTSEKKLKKCYLASPSFCTALADFVEKGLLVENYVVAEKGYRFFWRDPSKHEVDFVDVQNEEIIPIEVKYKEEVRKREMKNLILFSRKFKAKKAILLYKNIDQKILVEENLPIELKSLYLF